MNIQTIRAMFGDQNTSKLLAHFKSLSIDQLAMMALTSASLNQLAPLVCSIVEQAPEPAINAQWLAVDSSNIETVRYNSFAKTLDIRFISSAEVFYSYQSVPQFVFESLMESESKGSFFQQNIKGHFDFQKHAMTH